ncbi:hypothetical protein ACERII_00110 [Evansella sp. AB-rgal1]|uniref:hypothetical protein n=1 Tax=Evansella sp. AB-rgal1 TaxID=3242696 RepID=UPI00359D35F1
MEKNQYISFGIIFFIVVAVIIFFREPTQTTTNHDEDVEIKTNDIEIDESGILLSNLGYIYAVKGHLENVDFYFSERANSYSRDLIEETNIIISNSQELLKISHADQPLEIYFNTASEDFSIDSHSTRLALTAYSEESIGSIVSFLSDYKLPAWLSVGMELYWTRETFSQIGLLILQNRFSSEDHPFGDAWFIPGYIEHELRPNSKDVAYHFVQYLDEKSVLKDVIDLFLEDKAEKAASLLNQHWFDFSQSNTPLDFNYQYKYGFDDVLFQLNTEKVTTYFSNGNWSYKEVTDYIDYFEDSIRYVEEWFDYKGEEPIIFHVNPHKNSQNPNVSAEVVHSEIMKLYGLQDSPPLFWVSDLVEIITNRVGINTEFYPFKQGLANNIMYDFESMKKGYVQDAYLSFIKEIMTSSDSTSWEVIEKYNEVSKQPFQYDEPVDIHAFEIATSSVYDDEYKFHHSNYGPTMDNYFEELDGPVKASSFVLFLLEKQGKDDFLKVYSDIQMFEAVYGSDLKNIITEWKKLQN